MRRDVLAFLALDILAARVVQALVVLAVLWLIQEGA